MKFVLLIAADSVRSIRRHRVMLAFLLVALAGMGLVSRGVRSAALQAERMEQAQARATEAPKPDDVRIAHMVHRAQSAFHGFFAFALGELGSLLALVVFCTAVTGEMKSGTIRVTLAKPVPRGAYLVGKWLGAAAVLAAYSLVGAVAVGALGLSYGIQGAGALFAIPWLSFCGSLVTGTIGLVYSLFVRAPVAGVLAWFTSATWVGGIPLLYAVVPSYQPFEVGQFVFLGLSIGLSHTVIPTLYAADLVVILLLIAAARFRRMEIA